MHDLTLLDPASTGALTVAEIDATMAYAEAEKAESTRRAYESDWCDFAAWCAARGASPLPAHVGIVAAYLSDLADGGRKSSTIGRRAAAIAHRYKLAGHEPPTSAEAVRAVLRGIRRTIGAAPEKQAATADVLTTMLGCVPTGTLKGKRDRALLSLGFAEALRRSELVALEVGDLALVADGFRLTVRKSKTDQEGEGAEIAIPRGYRLRPVEAVQTWLAAAEISAGPLFRPVLKGGRIQPEALTAFSVALIVKHYAERAGLDPKNFAGHSLRAGFCTSAAEAGASIFKIAEVSRHASVDVLRGYVRRADLFREHAGAAFL
jgi:site-specific recombinase XerD